MRVFRFGFARATAFAGKHQQRRRQQGLDCQETLGVITHEVGPAGFGLASGCLELSQLEQRLTLTEETYDADS